MQVISAWVVSFGLLGCSAADGAESFDGEDRDVRPGQVLHAETSPVLRPDGSVITYHVETPDDATPPYGLVLVAQGSGCRPAGVVDSFPFSERIAPGFARLIVEKYGVDPAAPPPGEDACSSKFYERDTLDQRVLDAARVIGSLRSQEWWNGELILFGGSEGGAVVAMLAGLVPETDGVVILASGLGFTVEETVLAAVPPLARDGVAVELAAARRTRSTSERFGGHSHHWWATAEDKRPVTTLLPLDLPVLVVQGGRDTSAVPESARAGVALLEAAGRPVTYREHPGLDHSMRDEASEDRRPEVYADIGAWVTAVLAGGGMR
ncbi:MAG: hypothetical protein EA421_00775 [Gemmatimonadales bacterium]|nr:MAG: hypothetical protein EA421_00775 [Gemmatimonadales bacterium]